MTDKQPEALRLADWLESEDMPTEEASCAEAAAELLRLHALCEEMGKALSRLLNSDKEGAIATASDEILMEATYDTHAGKIVREQAAAVLQARAVLAKWKETE